MDLKRPAPPSPFYVGRAEIIADIQKWLPPALNGRPAVEQPQKVILSDVEGCLNFDPLTYDHEVLTYLRRANEAATWENAVPTLTLCTGRQAPYVDAFSAFLSVDAPVIFEGGCGLFFPTEQPGRGRTAWHPRIADAEASGEYDELQDVILGTARALGASQSLGKGRLLTFHAPQNVGIDDLLRAFATAVDGAGLHAEITRSANAVDITVAGVTKGSAVQWLLDTVADRGGPHLQLRDVIGIGDAPNDLAFLEVVGLSVAPSNALPAIQAKVDRVSRYTDAKAVGEVLVAAMRHNLAS